MSMNVVDYLISVAMLVAALKFLLYPLLRRMAWRTKVETLETRPDKLRPGMGFWGQAPGYDARGIYQVATHTPVYIVVILYALCRFPIAVLRWYFLKDPLNKISDEDVLDFCTKTSLVLSIDKDGDRCVFKTPTKCPDMGQYSNCQLSTLSIVFDKFEIVSATSANGEVVGTDKVGRNEVLIAALRTILGHWVHPTIHVAAERCALEIQQKRIRALEPSCHFVSSLHDGLLHGPLSPLGTNSPFYCGAFSANKMIEDSFQYPFPSHIISERKNVFEFYRFAHQARIIISRLVKKYNLNIDSELLFLNLIMHGLDHDGCYEVLSRFPLFSTDGTGSFYSYFRGYCFTHIWVKHVDNPLNSDRITSNLDKPFYRDLYAELSRINEDLADRIVVSCCF